MGDLCKKTMASASLSCEIKMQLIQSLFTFSTFVGSILSGQSYWFKVFNSLQDLYSRTLSSTFPIVRSEWNQCKILLHLPDFRLHVGWARSDFESRNVSMPDLFWRTLISTSSNCEIRMSGGLNMTLSLYELNTSGLVKKDFDIFFSKLWDQDGINSKSCRIHHVFRLHVGRAKSDELLLKKERKENCILCSSKFYFYKGNS